jgi:hypothetical protein
MFIIKTDPGNLSFLILLILRIVIVINYIYPQISVKFIQLQVIHTFILSYMFRRMFATFRPTIIHRNFRKFIKSIYVYNVKNLRVSTDITV